MGKYLLWWLVGWTVIAGIVYVFFAKETPDVMYGVAVAAGISLLFLIKMLSEKYEGEIIEVKEETYYVSDDDGPSREKRLVAIIRRPNGRTKKLQAMKGYEGGNYIVKKRGEASPKLYTSKDVVPKT